MSNHLKSLQLAAALPRGDKVQERRARLVARLQEQAKLHQSPDHHRTERHRRDGHVVEVQKRIVPWFRSDGSATTLSVRVGGRAIELAPGKPTVVVAEGKMEQVIETIVAAVRAGELDAQLARAAVAMGKKKSAPGRRGT